MTLDDLLRVYDAASDARYVEWTKDETQDDITNDDIKLAGIRALVEALRDHMCCDLDADDILDEFNEILASDGEVGPTVGEVAEGSLEVGPVQAAEKIEPSDLERRPMDGFKVCDDCARRKARLRVERYVGDRSSGCWLFDGPLDKKGYGHMKQNGKMMQAHRVAYMAYKGPIGAGLLVCHSCDQPSCVNPDHLFLGTPKDNTRDMMIKGRHRNGATKPIKSNGAR